MSTALAVVDGNTAGGALVARPRPSLLRPIAPPAEILQAQEETRALIKDALQEDRDYGKVPGTDKASLLKPGAERVTIAMGCYFGEPRIIEKEVDHDREVTYLKKGETLQSLGLYRYVISVPIINRATGETVGEGVGACSTMESKYVSRPRDCENTVLKMAHKRAIVGGCLVTFGLSDQFTQDVEDTGVAGDGESTVAPRNANEPAPPTCPKCTKAMWDNRVGKKNPKSPDFKCKDKQCDGAVWPGQWPPKVEERPAADASADASPAVKAADRPFPRTKRFAEYAGTPLGSLSSKVLTDALEAYRVASPALADAIGEVLADRADQAELAIDGSAAARDAATAPVGSKSVDVPPPGKVADALSAPVQSGELPALQDDDDDLPF